MENKVFYSAANNGFYFDIDKAAFVSGAGWPEDAKEISERWYNCLLEGQAKGKLIVPDKYSYPILAEPPAPTQGDLIAMATRKKSSLLSAASEAIAPLQDAENLGIATSDEKTALERWRLYRVMLNRVDVNAAPNILWPDLPA